MRITVEEEKVAIEAISTLVHMKRAMAELILKPAGVPPTVYNPLLYKVDESTGKVLSKRQIAPLILQATKQYPECSNVPRKVVEIAANWSSYHLAKDELIARGTVQMAQKVLGTVERMEAQEAQRREHERKEELARMERERAELLKRHSQLLLMMFDEMARTDNPNGAVMTFRICLIVHSISMRCLFIKVSLEMTVLSRLMEHSNLRGGII